MHTLTLQRRHRDACDAHHPQDSYTTEVEERRRNWKKCRCTIYAHGTLAGRFKKLATGARDWEFAKQIVAPYLAAGSWDVGTSPSPNPPPSPTTPPSDSPDGPPPRKAAQGLAIEDAIKSCLEEHVRSGDAPNTLLKYRKVLGQFARFSAEIGLRYIEEWTPAYVRQLRSSWGNGPLTTVKKLGILKAFFEIFVEDQVLETNPARIKNRANRALRLREGTNSKQKNPFTDEELKRMLDGCRDLGRTEKREWPKKRNGRQIVPISEYRDYHRKWTGQDLADFIQLSYSTGLRISDVATFHIDRLTPSGEVKIRATKNGNWISVWIPDWLRATIRARAVHVGPLIFGAHSTQDLNVITDGWRRKLNVLWEKFGPWAEKPTPHRFRHTFVRILLERNVPLALIAELAGDTEQMIRRHYSAWMPARQESASRLLAEAFRDVPRFHH